MLPSTSHQPQQPMTTKIRRFSLSKSAEQTPPALKTPPPTENATLSELAVENNAGTTAPDIISFRYAWPLKITKRLMSANEPLAILQFVWCMRMCDENCLQDIALEAEQSTKMKLEQRVNVTLYYKDGPSQDVTLESCRISVDNMQGERVFSELPLPGLEYTKGSGGWSPIVSAEEGHLQNALTSSQFSDYIHSNVGKHISISVQLRIHTRWFLPLTYLPSIDQLGYPTSNCPLKNMCLEILQEIRSNELVVPDVEFFNLESDKYALHRHIFNFACKEILYRSAGNLALGSQTELSEQIETIFGNVYFTEVLAKEAECFEDFVAMLDASSSVHFPALKRECERFICREVMLESADLAFVKKTWRHEVSQDRCPSHSVPVTINLRFFISSCRSNSLMSTGSNTTTTSADQQMTVAESMDEMREELMQIAEQITTATDDVSTTRTKLTHRVLMTKTKKILPNVAKISGSTAVVGVFSGHSKNRRSSLKTTRELLIHSPSHHHSSSGGSAFFAQISSSISSSGEGGFGSPLAVKFSSNKSNPKSLTKVPRRRHKTISETASSSEDEESESEFTEYSDDAPEERQEEYQDVDYPAADYSSCPSFGAFDLDPKNRRREYP
uniref:Uncharacterized protein n=1 Tax=Ditylenchus dipsaci TaxID=166011 RepID=A0A915E0A2_9BILA